MLSSVLQEMRYKLAKTPVIFTSKQAKAVKAFPLADPLTRNILNYLDYLHTLNPVPTLWLPSGKSVFGNHFMIHSIVRETSETLWPHLFLETFASDIVRQDNSVVSVFKVQKTLDLGDMANWVQLRATICDRRHQKRCRSRILLDAWDRSHEIPS
jgi:hypothetical protein